MDEGVFERDTDITIHLPADDASAVRALARSRGVSESELLREWDVGDTALIKARAPNH